MTRPANRLRIAMQKSGRLSDPARNLLKQAGFQFRSDKDQLFCYGEDCAIDLVLVRDDDPASHVMLEEACEVSPETAALINSHRAAGGRREE